MNKELEATLEHVLRMPDHWQKQVARAMLPTIYKWETRISLPHLSDEEFEQKSRAAHRPRLLQRMVRAVNRSTKRTRLPGFVLTAKNWAAAATSSLKSFSPHNVLTAGRMGLLAEQVSRLRRLSSALRRFAGPRPIQPETGGKSDRLGGTQPL